MKTEHLLRELPEIRSRLSLGDWQVVIFDIGLRLDNLRKAVISSDSHEMYRHVPVAIIAALETYFRGVVIDLVNRGEPYRSRVADLVKDKIVIKDAISFFHGETFTFGEVIAKSASCSSITDIHTWLEKLLGVDLKANLATAADPHNLRNGFLDAPPIVNDVDTLYRNVEEAFRLRHILAHEAATGIKPSKEDALQLIDSIKELTDGIDAVLWKTAYANLPLTQTEINQHAHQGYQEENEKLQNIIAQARKIAERDGMLDWFNENQQSWDSLCKNWIEGAYRNQMGTMWSGIAASEYASLVRHRSEILKGWIESRAHQ